MMLHQHQQAARRATARGQLVLLTEQAPDAASPRRWSDLTASQRDGLVAYQLMGWSPPGHLATIDARARLRCGAARFDRYWYCQDGTRAYLQARVPRYTSRLDLAFAVMQETERRQGVAFVGLDCIQTSAGTRYRATVRISDDPLFVVKDGATPAEALCLAALGACGCDPDRLALPGVI